MWLSTCWLWQIIFVQVEKTALERDTAFKVVSLYVYAVTMLIVSGILLAIIWKYLEKIKQSVEPTAWDFASMHV